MDEGEKHRCREVVTWSVRTGWKYRLTHLTNSCSLTGSVQPFSSLRGLRALSSLPGTCFWSCALQLQWLGPTSVYSFAVWGPLALEERNPCACFSLGLKGKGWGGVRKDEMFAQHLKCSNNFLSSYAKQGFQDKKWQCQCLGGSSKGWGSCFACGGPIPPPGVTLVTPSTIGFLAVLHHSIQTLNHLWAQPG